MGKASHQKSAGIWHQCKYRGVKRSAMRRNKYAAASASGEKACINQQHRRNEKGESGMAKKASAWRHEAWRRRKISNHQSVNSSVARKTSAAAAAKSTAIDQKKK